MDAGYDFGQLYGMADHSAGQLYEKGDYDAVVESAEYGRTKDGTKGQWTVVFRTTTGENAGKRKLTTNMTISPRQKDGSDNGAGLGIMFRELASLGIPVPDPKNPQATINGPAPFWVQGWSPQDVARAMVGKPCLIAVYQDEWGDQVRNKVRNIRPPRPGAPTDWPRQGQMPQAAQAGAMPGGFAPPAAPQGPPPGPPAQGPQPWQGISQQAGPPPQQAPQGPPAGAPPWAQQAQPQPYSGQPAVPQPQQGQPPIPGAPPWAQPPQPGQGGFGEFTGQGQSQQPGVTDQPVPGAPPAAPPWAGQPQPMQNGGPQQPQQAQQDPGGAPLPPWAQ